MIRLASIIAQYENDFIEKYGNKLLPGHYKAISAIKNCRSSHSLKMLVQCENKECSHLEFIPHSCGHRHCPHCQNHETQEWIEKQLQKQVPADYFMITFTLPAQFRNLAWLKQKLVYSLLFYCVWATIKLFSLNDKKLGGIPGAIAVLHTHSRELNFHPHIHIVMPAATIDSKRCLWSKKYGKYLFHRKALAKVFRAKMLNALSVNNIKLPHAYPKEWVVDCKYVGKGNKALIYLGQYLYRGVIKEKDILSIKNGCVTFRYKNSKTKQIKTKTVAAVDFIWLVLQHILPKGFRHAREYGFLHSNSKTLIKIIQWIFRINPYTYSPKIKKRKRMTCSCCGAFMNIVAVRIEASVKLPTLKPT
jgi:hypothetical protein